jgi:hypothetical protein
MPVVYDNDGNIKEELPYKLTKNIVTKTNLEIRFL